MIVTNKSSEQWLPIPGYAGLYEVSDLGHIRSLPREKMSRWGTAYRVEGGILKPHTNERGYRVARLTDGTGTKTVKVHRLVLLAFIGETPAGCTDTRHLNGDHGDNRLTNLTWGTHKSNMEDMVNHGTSPYGERSGRAILSSSGVAGMRRLRGTGKTIKVLADEFGVSRSTASYAVNGKSWSRL